MRDVSSVDPMWKPGQDEDAPARGGFLVRGLGRVVKTVAPFLVTWVEGMHPQVRVSWGSTEYHLRRDGIVAVRRDEPGFDDNPRSNYNDRLRKRQEKAGRTQAAPAPAPAEAAPEPEAPAPEAVAEKPTVDLSEAALQAAVEAKMGLGDAEAGETSRDPEVIKGQMSTLRATLQALDDVKDWDVVEGIDDELYQLHKAVEYKMRNHKASEAKSKLEDLFK